MTQSRIDALADAEQLRMVARESWPATSAIIIGTSLERETDRLIADMLAYPWLAVYAARITARCALAAVPGLLPEGARAA